MSKCPHCMSEEGYYSKDYAEGAIRTQYSFTNEEPDNSGMHSELRYTMGKLAYCKTCNKCIGKIKDLV